MKKLLLNTLFGALLAASLSQTTLAAVSPAPQFVKAQQLLTAKDYKGAYQEFDRIAKTGDAQALYNLGLLTEFGQGTAKDPKKALDYFKESAAKGYVLANYKLSQVYAGGQLGVNKDVNIARQYLTKAADQGLEQANVELALLLFAEDKPTSDKLALARLDPLIAKGSKQAMHAKAIYQISQGFKNKKVAQINEGLQSIQKLAEQGYIPALEAAANLYINGNILPQNLPEARKIYAFLATKNVENAKETVAKIDKLIAEQKAKPAAKK